jgi:small GTP-binding protein
MAMNFDLDFHGTKFTVTKTNLIKFFLHRPEVSAATTYEVQSTVPLEIFELFVTSLETGTKIPITTENASAISTLAREFWVEDLFTESSSVQAASSPDLVAALSERISTLEHQLSSQVLIHVSELKESIKNQDRQLETVISSIESTAVTLRREIDDVRHSVQLVHMKLEMLKSETEIQIDPLRMSISAVDRKITESLSPITMRLSVCEEQLKSRSHVPTPNPTSLPVSKPTQLSVPPDSAPTPKPAKKSWFSWGARAPSPLPTPPPPVSRNFDERADQPLKFVLVGNSCVGKTRIFCQFTGQKYDGQVTAGGSLLSKTIDVHGHRANLQVWDTAGVERFRSIMFMYCRLAVGALAVYDVTDSHSFASMGDWIRHLRELAHPKVAIILIGNKADLDTSRAVTFEEGRSFAERENVLFMETSGEDATNISEAFELLTAEVIERYENGSLD